jgi:hypothetical protein
MAPICIRTHLKFNQPMTVKTDRGDLPALLVGVDDTGHLARVSVYTARAPEWFQEAHTSRHPHVWVSLADVEVAVW